MLEVLQFAAIVPPEAWAVLLATGVFLGALAKAVGALTAVVIALKLFVPWLEARAKGTATKKDDAAIETLSICLGVSAVWLGKLQRVLEVVAGNRFLNEQVVKVEKDK